LNKSNVFKIVVLPALEDPPVTLVEVEVETEFDLELIGDDAVNDKCHR
jgi:hypothetical protein